MDEKVKHLRELIARYEEYKRCVIEENNDYSLGKLSGIFVALFHLELAGLIHHNFNTRKREVVE